MAEQVSTSSQDVISNTELQTQPVEQLQSSYRYSDVLIKMRKEAA